MPQLNKVSQAERAFAEMVGAVSRRGFYGTASVTLVVQDGRIQNVRLATERMMK